MNEFLVLIVAKCIVNWLDYVGQLKSQEVLIVAKCIVNHAHLIEYGHRMVVLIVAKCIVNIIDFGL